MSSSKPNFCRHAIKLDLQLHSNLTLTVTSTTILIPTVGWAARGLLGALIEHKTVHELSIIDGTTDLIVTR